MNTSRRNIPPSFVVLPPISPDKSGIWHNIRNFLKSSLELKKKDAETESNGEKEIT